MLKQLITTSYGDDDYKKATKLQKLCKQSAIAKNQWIFLERCIAHDLLPSSFKSRSTIKTEKGQNITRMYNKSMLVAAKYEAKERYHKHLHNIRNMRSYLQDQAIK